jgi:O-antigen/teichoic acid export membrane protein
MAVFVALFAGRTLALGGQPPGLLTALGATAAADMVRACAYAVRFRGDRPVRASVRAGLGFLVDTFPFFLITLASAFAGRIDLYCLGFFAHRDELGQYNVLVSLIGGQNMIIAAIPDTFSVTLLRAPERVFARAWRGLYAVSLVLMAGGTVAIGIVMRHLYGLPLSPGQLLLIFAGGVGQLVVLKAFFVITRDMSQLVTTVAVVAGGFANLLAALALIPRHGVTGGLIASNAGIAAIVVVSLLLIRRHHAHLRRHDHV